MKNIAYQKMLKVEKRSLQKTLKDKHIKSRSLHLYTRALTREKKREKKREKSLQYVILFSTKKEKLKIGYDATPLLTLDREKRLHGNNVRKKKGETGE